MVTDPNTELSEPSRGQKIVGSGCVIAIPLGLLVGIIWLVSVCENGDSTSRAPAPTARPTVNHDLVQVVYRIENVQWEIEELSDEIADETQLSDEWCRIFLEIDKLVREYDRLNARLDRLGGRNPDPAFERELADLKNQFDFDIFARSCRF